MPSFGDTAVNLTQIVDYAIVAVESEITVALVTLLVIRQVRGQYMDRRGLWVTPVVLTDIGLVYAAVTVPAVVLPDVLLVGLGVVVSVAVGLGLAEVTTVRTAAEPDRRGRRLVIRSGWRGGALWVVFVAARLALQPLAAVLDARLIVSPGMILILIATARAAMAVLLSPRLEAAAARLAPLETADGRT